jgi:hypothetical protein
MEIFNYCLQLIDMCVKHDKTHSALTNKIMIVMMTHESVAGDAKTLGNIFVEIHKELKLDKDRTVALLGATRETLLDLKSKGQAIFRNYCSASIENFMELYKEAFPFLRKNDLDIKDIDETNAGNLKHFIDGDTDSESERLAGGVDIARMATQPAGYQAYSMMMPDVAFYAPKEIYKNQVNVDNARVLRQLSSDKLHQDLVNLQYK